jgi:hypothetical protein
MWDNLIDMAKGVAWGIVILILAQMCVGCQTSQRVREQTYTLSDVEGVSFASDSLLRVSLENVKASRFEAVETKENSYTIDWSEPDDNGKQYKTRETYKGVAAISKTETNTQQSRIRYEKRIQRQIDSLRNRLRIIEETERNTQRTSGGVFSWSGKETATILAIVLLIVILWIVAKGRGYI